MVADRIGRGAQEDPSPDVRREAARVAGSHPSDALPEPTRGQNPPLQD
jgi:hypothetical protein